MKHKRQHHAIVLFFYGQDSLGPHCYFHLFASFSAPEKRTFYVSICWGNLLEYRHSRLNQKPVLVIIQKCKSAQNHNFYDTAI